MARPPHWQGAAAARVSSCARSEGLGVETGAIDRQRMTQPVPTAGAARTQRAFSARIGGLREGGGVAGSVAAAVCAPAGDRAEFAATKPRPR